jgi:predicted ester cyclase
MRIITDDPTGASGKLQLLGQYSERMVGGDDAAVTDLWADDFHSNVTNRVTPEAVGSDVRGEEQLYWQQARAAFPDMTFEVNLLVEADDLVISNWTIKGTHTGAAFYDVEPTGEPVEINGTAILRIADGKIAEHWGGPHCQKGLGLLPLRDDVATR